MTKLRPLPRVAQDGNQLCYVLIRGSLNQSKNHVYTSLAWNEGRQNLFLCS